MATRTEPIARPSTLATWWDTIVEWATTVDHKKIGILYILASMGFFLFGGIEALMIRTQLAGPELRFIHPQIYNEVLTMHGTTMIFLVVMPILTGFGNYFIPLMIGARDMAFPRLNMLGFWLFVFGGILLYLSFLSGGAPDGGWFAYAPLTDDTFSPTHGMDFWILGLTVTGIASITGAINFVVTILNMRAPGMTLNRMPLFVWTTLVTAFLILFAFPSLTVATIFLFFDRNFGTGFYSPEMGGTPLLWQHLFWFFGHPEVYIMILPAFGLISEMVPVFSRKPIFGYAAVVYASVAIGFIGFTVWAHHMFAVGMPPVVTASFGAASMIIAVPTAIKIFNWVGTMWGGSLRLRTPMLFAISFVAMFLIGGLTGIFLATVPVDWQLTDSYFVVAHFHYVLFGGAFMSILGAAYYWFPKMTGRMMDERLGFWNWLLIFVGFNMTFFPMHILGLDGMPRRIATYGAGLGWDFWNFVSTVGAFMIGVGMIVFFINFFHSLRNGPEAGDNPWEGWTLEWATASPPPAHNFDGLPPITSRRPLWDVKLNRVLTPEEVKARLVKDEHIHLPPPSIWPLIVGLGVVLIAAGMIYTYVITVLGVVTWVVGVLGWIQQKGY
ncbi:MAG: cytochrome c oxidase subunit I [Ardenticatenia bacterium]|nr:MAG: cytochrome c oxidase subunit I [Ardenticatenia bacterium]